MGEARLFRARIKQKRCAGVEGGRMMGRKCFERMTLE